ncbi:transesterase [Xylariomycetidae sp. FL2044]|nr:transesterase [Xylariomycetidae sp. FL2044]
MDAIDKAFENAVSDGSIHGAVLLARDITGKVNISRSYGVRSLRDPDPTKRPPMTADTPMRIASASKLLSSIMALQCVDQGLVGLDDTLERLLPEVAGQKVLIGYDEDGKPIERDPKSPVRLRQLLSHTSGVAYAVTSPRLARYRQNQGVQVDQGYDTLDENFTFPLIFDPGTSYCYGPGLDWSSRLVARASPSGLSSTTTVEAFLQRHLAAPLGLGPDDMTFELQKHPGTRERRADMTVRVDVDGGSSSRLEYRDEDYWHRDKEPHGGQGIYTSPEAYMRVLWSILANDGVLLRPATRDLLFQPDLAPDVGRGTMDFCKTFEAFGAAVPIPPAVKKAPSVGGMITLEDCDGDRWRRKGNLSWSGLPNFIWTIDLEAGVCIVWAFHLKPSFDPICTALGKQFEECVFAMVKQ